MHRRMELIGALVLGSLITASISFAVEDQAGALELLVASSGTDRVLLYDGQTGAFQAVFVDQCGGRSEPSGELDSPFGLVPGPDGDLYVTSLATHEVLRYNGQTGAFRNAFVAAGSGGLSGPLFLVFGLDGDLYVTSSSTSQVLRYDGQTGAFRGVFVAAGSGGLNFPTGLVFGPDGDLYVASGERLGRVLRYDGQTGAFRGVFVAAGSGGLNSPFGLVFGPDDNLFVASNGTNEVLRYNGKTGASLGTFADEPVFPEDNCGLLFPVSLVFRAGPLVRMTLNENQAAFTVDPASQKTTTGSMTGLTSLVGDSDDFHPGDPADELSPLRGNQSQHVQDILAFFVPEHGFQGAVDLDEEAVNEAVGFTHFVTLPPQSQITDATVTFTIKGTGDNVQNDTILYNQSMFDDTPPPGALPGFAPFIALRDLLGKAPQANQTYTLRIDLSQVPVRFANTSPPGGGFSGDPDAFKDLRPLLASQSRFDMVFSDDTVVDGSLLRVSLQQPIDMGCPSGSVALFSFTATLTNLMPNTLDDIRIVVNQATSSGVQLLLPSGELVVPFGEASLSELTPAHVSRLQERASVMVPFNLCLASLAPFSFFVDVTALVPDP